MSQNRMWLVNRQTNQRVLLAKHNASRWYVFHDDLVDAVDATLEDEDARTRADGRQSVGGSRDWEVEYENDEWPPLPRKQP